MLLSGTNPKEILHFRGHDDVLWEVLHHTKDGLILKAYGAYGCWNDFPDILTANDTHALITGCTPKEAGRNYPFLKAVPFGKLKIGVYFWIVKIPHWGGTFRNWDGGNIWVKKGYKTAENLVDEKGRFGTDKMFGTDEMWGSVYPIVEPLRFVPFNQTSVDEIDWDFAPW